MFGLDTISWEQFTGFILAILLAWYVLVILFCFFRKKHQKSLCYEDMCTDEGLPKSELHPVRVSSNSFPSGLILYPNEDIPLEVVYYEETGEEEGYIIDEFTKNNHPEFRSILQKFQYQQQ
ncbi:hypothetical protein [Maribellus maritimus]|uniref:hypothetical protein n=1 Tax=Maribellus maritimus TaxID=2870838 RepID=UPI001EEC06E9|nr:hypothetical protein [Maribellus maritimus]MCG6190846.1 hypothetical protein [Maribellus maritimus]